MLILEAFTLLQGVMGIIYIAVIIALSYLCYRNYILSETNKDLTIGNQSLQNQIQTLRNEGTQLKDENIKITQQINLKVTKAVEAERLRIGNNLHDHLGSLFWALKVQFGIIESSPSKSQEVADAARVSNQIMDEVIQTNKEYINDLVPKSLLVKGLGYAVREHCERLSSANMQFKYFESNGHEPMFQSFSKSDGLVIFQIIKEILSNCLKYADAKTIIVAFNWGIKLHVSIVNDGIAYKLSPQSFNINTMGYGTLTITERVDSLGGSISSEAGPPNQLLLSFPILTKNSPHEIHKSVFS